MEIIYRATVQVLDIRPCKIVLDKMETESAMRVQSILRRFDIRPCRIVLDKQETEAALHSQFQRLPNIRPCSVILNALPTIYSPLDNDGDCLMSDLDSAKTQCEEAMELDENEMCPYVHPPLSSTMNESEISACPCPTNNTNQNAHAMELGFQSLVDDTMNETKTTALPMNNTNRNTHEMEDTTIWSLIDARAGKVRFNDPSVYEPSSVSTTEKATDISTLLLEYQYERAHLAVKSLLSNHAVHIYGSHLYNLSDVSSDLNFFIDCGKLPSLNFDMQHCSMVDWL